MGQAIASIEYILPAFPCHICMWLLVISATLLEKENRISQIIKDFTFWGGTVCGTIGIVLNENFAANPTLTNYYVLKGLLSHSTMLLGCILLLSTGYVKISAKRAVIAVSCGLVLFGVDGIIVNSLYEIYGLGEFNAMYLQSPSYEELPFINVYTVCASAPAVAFFSSVIYEKFALPREKRWCASLIKKKQSSRK